MHGHTHAAAQYNSINIRMRAGNLAETTAAPTADGDTGSRAGRAPSVLPFGTGLGRARPRAGRIREHRQHKNFSNIFISGEQ